MIFFGFSNSFGQAGFTISESLMRNDISNISLGGTAYLTGGNIDAEGSGWLRLTNAEIYQTGYAIVNQSFNASQGVVVDFEFAIWGGDGADGFSIFLFDGNYTMDTNPNSSNYFRVGGNGGALGYANGNNNLTGTRVNGMTGGYLGVGLDAYGNYSVANEFKVGGISQYNENPNRIGIRGPEISNLGGYRWLGGSDNLKNVFGSDFNLDYKNAVNNIRPDINNYYRRVQLRVLPIEVSGNLRYQITVHLKVANDLPFQRVLGPLVIEDIPPSVMKVGFAGVTGGQTNIHEVRNLVVTTLGGVRVHKTVDKQQVKIGDEINYDIKLINESGFPAEQLLFSDLIPPELEIKNVQINTFNNTGNNIISGWAEGQSDLSNIHLNLAEAPYGEMQFRVTGVVQGYPNNLHLINRADLNLTDLSNIRDDDLSNNFSEVVTEIIPYSLSAENDSFIFNSTNSNVLSNDRFELSVVDLTKVNIQIVQGAIGLRGSNIVPYIDVNTGVIVTPNGTPRGNYSITYRIVDRKGEFNFAEATVFITKENDIFSLSSDVFNINWQKGGETTSVLINDQVNNRPFSFLENHFEWLSIVPDFIILRQDGSIFVNPLASQGTYYIKYRIIDYQYPDNYQEQVAELNILKNKLVAVNDKVQFSFSRGSIHQYDVFKNDLINEDSLSLRDVNYYLNSPNITGVYFSETGDLILTDELRYGEYTFTYTVCEKLDVGNCSSATIQIVVDPPSRIIPNVVSPNGDGLNDVFYIPIDIDLERMELEIFDRRGNVIYSTDNYQNDWSPNFSDFREGTCLYKLILHYTNKRKIITKGNILIIRDKVF